MSDPSATIPQNKLLESNSSEVQKDNAPSGKIQGRKIKFEHVLIAGGLLLLVTYVVLTVLRHQMPHLDLATTTTLSMALGIPFLALGMLARCCNQCSPKKIVEEFQEAAAEKQLKQQEGETQQGLIPPPKGPPPRDIGQYFESEGIFGVPPALVEILKAVRNLKTAPSVLLFSGPPGTGKTMLAEAISKSLGVGLKKVSCSQIASKFFGAPEKNMKSIFPGERAPFRVIFLDEADALLYTRSDDPDRAHNAGIVATFLGMVPGDVDYDAAKKNYLLILATNRKSVLDDAVLSRVSSPCRIEFVLPDEEMRTKIFQAHTKKKWGETACSSLQYSVLGKQSEGLSGRDIAQLIRDDFTPQPTTGSIISNISKALIQNWVQTRKKEGAFAKSVVENNILKVFDTAHPWLARRILAQVDMYLEKATAWGVHEQPLITAIQQAMQEISSSP